MSRATTILSRFPAHFEAAKPGKLIGDVAAALARDMDAQFAQMGGIRRARRLREAWTDHDLLALAALHRIRPAELAVLTDRLDLAAERADALATADDAGREDAAKALLALFSLDLPDAPLTGFDSDPVVAADHLVEAVRAITTPAARRAAMVTRIHDIAQTHLHGNGTVAAVLRAAANALDMDVIGVAHSADRYWHVAQVRDRLCPTTQPALTVVPEVLGIEENPLRRGRQPPEARTHAECFNLTRKGFDPAPLEITVTAEAHRTVAPVIVNRDQGRGVGFSGVVPAGQTLTFTEAGRALLNGADVTALCFGFEGGLFADATTADPDATGKDAGFDVAKFVITTPAAALDRDATYPHDGPSLPMPDIGIGVTRMAFFVQEGHYARGDGYGLYDQYMFYDAMPTDTIYDDDWYSPPVTPVTPRHKAGVLAGPGFDGGAVFAPAAADPNAAAALVGFSWAEHQAYRARVILPARFAEVSPEDNGRTVAARVRAALDRVRPVGVALDVTFAEDRWVLGEAALPAADDDTPGDDATSLLSQLAGHTELWPAPQDADPS